MRTTLPAAFATASPSPILCVQRNHRSPHSSRCARQSHPHLITSPPPSNARLTANVTYHNHDFTRCATSISPNGFARFILLSDGHLSPRLSIITRSNLILQHVSTTIPPSEHSPLSKNSQFRRIYPLNPVRRTVVFVHPSASNEQKSQPLLYSSSTWCPDAYASIMINNEDKPISQVFEEQKVSLSRQVLSVSYGTCPSVAATFDLPPSSTMWARNLIFYQHNIPFLYIHQILSPVIQSYVGDMQPSIPITSAIPTTSVNPSPHTKFAVV